MGNTPDHGDIWHRRAARLTVLTLPETLHAAQPEQFERHIADVKAFWKRLAQIATQSNRADPQKRYAFRVRDTKRNSHVLTKLGLSQETADHHPGLAQVFINTVAFVSEVKKPSVGQRKDTQQEILRLQVVLTPERFELFGLKKTKEGWQRFKEPDLCLPCYLISRIAPSDLTRTLDRLTRMMDPKKRRVTPRAAPSQ